MHYRINTALVVLAVLACVAVGRADPIVFSVGALSYVGTAATLPGGGVRLTPNYDTDPSGPPPAGAVWTTDPVSVGLGFTVSFNFRMSDGTGWRNPNEPGPTGGDGFAFVIQNDPSGNQAIGLGAGGLGYMDIQDSLAVEFDTYWNQLYYADPDGNHVSVHSLGLLPNMPHHTDTGTDIPWLQDNPDLGTALIDRYLNDGLIQNAEIVYVPGYLSVYLNGVSLFPDPLQINLDNLLNLTDGNAYIGFTAGTRGAFQNQDVLMPVPEPGTCVLLSVGLVALAFLRSRRYPN